MLEKCLQKGIVTEEDYFAAGERKSYRTDMVFATQLGLVERKDESTYRINTKLTPSLNSIEETTKNDLAAMYKIFGDGIFSSDMVVADDLRLAALIVVSISGNGRQRQQCRNRESDHGGKYPS